MHVQSENTGLTLRWINRFREEEENLAHYSAGLMNQFRNKALQDFVSQGFPARKTENYKYTDLQPAFSKDYAIFQQRDQADFRLNDIFRCDIPQLDSYLMLLQNGWFRSVNSDNVRLPEGVLAASLGKIARGNPELVNDYYSKLADTSIDPMVALNTMFARDGYYMYIPEKMRIKRPIQIINMLQAEQDTFVTQRNLVVVEPGAEVKLIICDHTLNLNNYLNNSVTEIFIGENAIVDFYIIQNQHNKTTSVNSVFYRLEKGAHLTTHAITLHGGLIRNNLHIAMEGENGEANVYGMAFIDKKQHVDNFTLIEHAKPNCLSNQQFKNVLDDEATGAFSGRIHVHRDAQKTNAYQRNNNLLLTDKALMQTKPQLIIEADDVKCSHGATVGQIDQDALFYLRARGIGESQARLMMMHAFSYEVIQEIRVEALRDRISDLVDKRLRGDVARCHECAYQCES